MREIKFRAWDKEKNKFVPPYNFVSAVVGDLTLELKNNDRVIFLQYTGLKDKNGVEIYECDIVKFGSSVPVLDDMPKDGLIGVIQYFINGFYVDSNEVKYSLDELGDWVVIGNIYENPELLED